MPLTEQDYTGRVPSIKYFNMKTVENLALSAENHNPLLNSYVVWSGFLYGCGESIFYDYFEMAWEHARDALPLITNGKNKVPTIHVQDLVNLIKKIIDFKPSRKQILAVDKTQNSSLENLVTCISTGIGSGKVNFDSSCSHEFEYVIELNSDLWMTASEVFDKDEKDESGPVRRRTFQWQCEVKR